VAAFDPPRRLTLRSQAGPDKLTIDHELEPNRGGNAAHRRRERQARGVMKLAGPMIERTAREEIRGDFAWLKELLETWVSYLVSGSRPFAIRATAKTRNRTAITASLCRPSQSFSSSRLAAALSPPSWW
jgi:hypothetical protein